MEQAQALAIVRSLADGVDPESGEMFPPESAYQRPQVVRALYAAAEALDRSERFERRKAQLPAKTGEPWSEEEDRKLLAAFDAGGVLAELAGAHQRTQTGIRARLVKYGRMAARRRKGGVRPDAPRSSPLEYAHHEKRRHPHQFP